MKFARLGTSKWLTEGKIADDVESREVEPVHHIENFILSSHPFHMRDELIHITLNNILLFHQRLLTKRMARALRCLAWLASSAMVRVLTPVRRLT